MQTLPYASTTSVRFKGTLSAQRIRSLPNDAPAPLAMVGFYVLATPSRSCSNGLVVV